MKSYVDEVLKSKRIFATEEEKEKLALELESFINFRKEIKYDQCNMALFLGQKRGWDCE